MARGKPKVETATDDRLRLIEALKFTAIATKDGEGKFAFVQIRDNWLTAANDTFTLGIRVDIALDLCPQAETFLSALQQCGQSFQLTQVELNAVSIRSGNYRALVPALTAVDVAEVNPDDCIAVINDKLRDAMIACVKVLARGERVFDQGVLLQDMTMVATSGRVLIEYWHGINLPPGLIIPKKTVDTIIKINKPLAGFGFSGSSVTFWFEDGSYLKTNLVTGTYPDYGRLFADIKAPFQPLWADFYAALGAINSFIKEDTFFWNQDNISSHHTPEMGATYRVPGVPHGHAWNPVLWKQIEQQITHVAIGFAQDPVGWFGPCARGLIVGKHR